MSVSRKERRNSRRRRRRLPVRFWREGMRGTGFTADVSNTGAMIETTIGAEIGDRVHIELELPDGTPFFAEGLVVRKKVYPRHARSLFKPALGIKFVTLAQAIRAVLDDGPATEPELPPEESEPGDGGLRVDLRDPAELSRIYDRDIKHGAVQIPTSQQPPVDEEVSVVFLLPEPNGTLECRGQVVAHVDQPPGVGVRLQDVDQLRTRLLEIIRDS